MNFETEKTVYIGDKQFLISRFFMTEGMKKKARLLQLIGAVLSKSNIKLSSQDTLKKLLDSDFSLSEIGALILGFFSQIDPEQLPDLVKEFLTKTYLISNGERKNAAQFFDMIFTNEKDVFSLLKEVVVFNLGDLGSVKKEIESFLGFVGPVSGSQESSSPDENQEQANQDQPKPRIMAR